MLTQYFEMVLLASSLTWNCTTVVNFSFDYISFIFLQVPGLVDQYMSTLLSLDQSPSCLPLLAVCVDFCTTQKDMATINKHKVGISHNTQLYSTCSVMFKPCI